MLGLQVVETQQGQIIVNTKKYPTMIFWYITFSTDDFYVFNQGDINLFGQIDSLEKIVVFLLLVQVVVHNVFVENTVLNQHQSFNVFEVDVLFESSGQKE